MRPGTLPSEVELTYSTDEPRRVIDWVAIPSGWEFYDYQTIETDLSDHRP